MKRNRGVSIIALVIIIIILLVLAGIGINYGMKRLKEAEDVALETELTEVQHAVLEQYNKYMLTKKESNFIGEEYADTAGLESDFGITAQDTSKYYGLKRNHLNELNIWELQNSKEINDEVIIYVVNYQTSEVFNILKKETNAGNMLYIKAKADTPT